MMLSDFRLELEIQQFAHAMKKYAIQPLFMAELTKFPRLK